MSTDCIVCRELENGGAPGVSIPVGWTEMWAAGTVYASWIPADLGVGSIFLCKSCGRYWHAAWNPRDSVFESVAELPGGREAALKARSEPPRVMGGARSEPLTLAATVKLWLEGLPVDPEVPIKAIGNALAGRTGVLAGPALQQCLSWLQAIAARNAVCALAVASNQEVLGLLATLPERPRTVADKLRVPTSLLTRTLYDIGRQLDAVCLPWAACLKALNAPEAIRERALAVLRLRLADARFPHELVLQATEELSSWEGNALLFDTSEVDLMLDLYAHEIERGPGPPVDIARGLHRAFESWLRTQVLPAERRIQVLHAFEENAKALAVP